MGRKTLLQSTGKKKTAKKDEDEKKKAQKKKTTPVKSKAAAKPKKTKASTAKPKKTAKATAKKRATPKAKKTTKAKTTQARARKPSLKTILFRQFDSAMPESPPKGPAAKKTKKLPEAPPFISADNKNDAERMKTLLFKQFDLYEKTSPKKAAPKTPAKKKTPSTKELLFKQFDSAMPESPPKGPAAKKTEKLPEAPPFISADNKNDAERMKTLLFKQFDLYEKPTAEKTAAAPIGAQSPPSSPSPKETEPTSKGLLWGIGLAAVLIAILVWSSTSNTNNFYIKPSDSGIQIWQGKFAPTGAEKVVTIEGMKAPEPIKEVYSKEEVLPLVFKYFRDQADAALAARKGPDFAEIKRHLRQALAYAPSAAERRQVQSRLKVIDFMVLFHRAEVAMAKGTKEGLANAKAYLKQAGAVATSAYQKELVSKTQTALQEATAALREK